MARQLVQALTPSTEGFQILWPQMTYLRLSAPRLFITHSAICLPDTVGTYIAALGLASTTAAEWRGLTYTASIRTHKINRLAAAMIRRAGAGTVPGAANLPHPPRPRSNHLLGPRNRHRLAPADRGDPGRRVPAEPGRCGRAALHLRRAGAQAGFAAAAAVALPAAVACAGVGARGFGAAFYVGCVGGAGA